MRNEQPRYALVQWPTRTADERPGPPCCIVLDALPNAIARGALVIAREDALLPVVTFNTPRIVDADGGDCA